MTTKLKYAGAEPYKPEDSRLPHPVYEVISQDEAYQALALLRYHAYEVEEDLNADETVPDEVAEAVFHAADTDFNSIRAAVDQYVAEWIDREAQTLVEDWGIDPAKVSEAADLYGVIELIDVEVPA